MSEYIRFNVYVKVKEGRLEEFRGIARDWSAWQKQARPDILSYEWFFPEQDPMTAQVMEVYESSEAILATLQEVDASEVAEEPDYPYEMTKIEVCGPVSDALKARLDKGKSPIEYWTRINGFTR